MRSFLSFGAGGGVYLLYPRPLVKYFRAQSLNISIWVRRRLDVFLTTRILVRVAPIAVGVVLGVLVGSFRAVVTLTIVVALRKGFCHYRRSLSIGVCCTNMRVRAAGRDGVGLV